MIEIVFSESAEGGLRIAQSYGKDRYQGGCTAVFLGKIDGRKPTAQELEAARLEAEARERQSWEKAVPLGGSTKDVFCFDLALSFGEIRKNEFWRDRARALGQLHSCWPEAANAQAEVQLEKARRSLDEVLQRSKSEPVRIWSSDQPDEACGMYWLLAQLVNHAQEIRLVKLPAEKLTGNELRRYHGWGEVEPGAWSGLLKYESALADLQQRAAAARWRELQEENLPLRAVVSGQLISLPAGVYDHFIRWEIDRQEDKFRQARVIGDVLGRHRLGISDGYVALRMDEMIRSGELEILEEAGEGEPSYRRILKKVQR